MITKKRVPSVVIPTMTDEQVQQISEAVTGALYGIQSSLSSITSSMQTLASQLMAMQYDVNRLANNYATSPARYPAIERTPVEEARRRFEELTELDRLRDERRALSRRENAGSGEVSERQQIGDQQLSANAISRSELLGQGANGGYAYTAPITTGLAQATSPTPIGQIVGIDSATGTVSVSTGSGTVVIGNLGQQQPTVSGNSSNQSVMLRNFVAEYSHAPSEVSGTNRGGDAFSRRSEAVETRQNPDADNRRIEPNL